MDSLFLKEINIHSDWNNFLSKDIIKQIVRIENEVTKTAFTPPPEKVLRFLKLPLNTVKIIILGQDPYPQADVATGRAFEVGTLKSWNEPFKNISLKNILRALYQAYFGETIKYNELKEKFDNEFPILPPGKFFQHWEKQGVLLLNTSFTCQTGKPGSHQQLWQELTLHLLEFINEKKADVTWFLWGNHALGATENIEIKNKCITQHPMMCFDKPRRERDFLYGKVNCFELFIPEIDWTGFNLKPGLKSAGTLF